MGHGSERLQNAAGFAWVDAEDPHHDLSCLAPSCPLLPAHQQEEEMQSQWRNGGGGHQWKCVRSHSSALGGELIGARDRRHDGFGLLLPTLNPTY